MGLAPDGRGATSLLLSFDVPGRSLHCPMLEATVAGGTTRLIVDTGATSHLLTTDLVERAGLRLTAAAPGRDVAGDHVPTWSVGDVVAEVGSSRVVLRDVVAIDGPEPFRDWGVGGFVSPQLLASDTIVLVDLVTNRLDIMDVESANVDALVRRFDRFVLMEGTRHVAGTIGIELAVPPAAPVVAIFDTGAPATEVAAGAVAGAVEAAKQASGKGVGGTSIEVAILRDQQLAFGAFRLRVPEVGVRDEIPAPDDAAEGERPLALIGMDLLRGTVLAITPPGEGSVWWFVPAGDG